MNSVLSRWMWDLGVYKIMKCEKVLRLINIKSNNINEFNLINEGCNVIVIRKVKIKLAWIKKLKIKWSCVRVKDMNI